MSAVEGPRSVSRFDSLRDGVARDTLIGFVLGGALGVLIGLLATAVVGAVFLGGALALVLAAVAFVLSLTGRVVSWAFWHVRTRETRVPASESY